MSSYSPLATSQQLFEKVFTEQIGIISRKPMGMQRNIMDSYIDVGSIIIYIHIIYIFMGTLLSFLWYMSGLCRKNGFKKNNV